MYQIHCLNKISPIGTGRFGDNYTVGAELAQADAVCAFCRHARHGAAGKPAGHCQSRRRCKQYPH